METSLFEIVEHPIDVEEVRKKVVNRNAGAITLFVGTVREMTNGKKTLFLEYQAYLTALIPDSNPKTFCEALLGPSAALWEASMKGELTTLDMNNTLQLLPRSDLPPGHDIIPV